MTYNVYRWVQRLIIVLFTAMMGLLVYMVVPVFEKTDFYLKRSFLLPQWQLLLIGVVGICFLYVVTDRLLRKRIFHANQSRRLNAVLELSLWGMLFVFQAVVSYFAYFMTDWDAGIILDTAWSIASYGYPEFLDHEYFSVYSNNVLITEIFAQIIRLFRLFVGDPGKDRCALILIFVQCMINTATGLLCRWSTKKLTGSKTISVLVGIVYVLFVGVSPWTMIPYSDGMGLILPMMIFCLYQLQRDSKWCLPCWGGIGVLTVLSLMIKPQAAIMAIAVVMMESARLMYTHNFRRFAGQGMCLLLVLLIGMGPVQDYCFEQSMLEVDAERSVGPLHYVMLGLNEKTSGTYSAEDQFFSASFRNSKERTTAQLGEIRSRLEAMGIDGLFELLKHKTLINYGDGTFSWGINGYFFHTMIKDKDNVISPFLKDLLYTCGSRYPLFSTMLQSIWLGLLVGSVCIFGVLGRLEEKQRTELCALCLSIIGLTVFEWIFEAKARYLYLYAPQYVMLGVWGIGNLCGTLKRSVRKIA